MDGRNASHACWKLFVKKTDEEEVKEIKYR